MAKNKNQKIKVDDFIVFDEAFTKDLIQFLDITFPQYAIAKLMDDFSEVAPKKKDKKALRDSVEQGIFEFARMIGMLDSDEISYKLLKDAEVGGDLFKDSFTETFSRGYKQGFACFYNQDPDLMI